MKKYASEIPSVESNLYHSLSTEDVLSHFRSSHRGLSTDEAFRRLTQYGPNLITKEKGIPLWHKFAVNLTNIFAILLWAAAALSFATDSNESGIAIVAVIIINAVFSFVQEYRAERAIAALQSLLPIEAKVRRNGETIKVPAADLVPGDILILEEGDNISADGRLIEEFDLRTNNSTLTGESEPVRKTAEPVACEGLTLTQMPNLVFAGTTVASGTSEAVVFATGMSTTFGQIAHVTQSVKAEASPLQIQFGSISKTVTLLSLLIGVVFFLIGRFIAHLNLHECAIFAIGIVIANVPEGLLPTLSLALASAAKRLASRHALVKKLSAVETLGSTTVICTDKTGTLTQNEMTVTGLWVSGRDLQVSGIGYEPTGEVLEGGSPVAEDLEDDIQWLVRVASLCNNARLLEPEPDKPQWRILGDSTEGALLVAAIKAGFNSKHELNRWSCVTQLPFDSRRKLMSVIYQVEDASTGVPPFTRAAFTKGAPKEVLSLCTHLLVAGEARVMTEEDRAAAIKQNDRYAGVGLRVLAMAFRLLPGNLQEHTIELVEKQLTFIGLIAMQDPPRPEVFEAVGRAQSAGIRVVMVTGDYGLTAVSIASKIGILSNNSPRIITGSDLDAMDGDTLGKTLSSSCEIIFSRVAPEHKLRIVETFRSLGEIVAVTGDGVNDAPALKRADIGVAMGQSGTDVAKEASTMILTNDNFASIIAAVEEGRAVYDNIRKFVTYIFAHLAAEAAPYAMFALFNLPLPLTPLQILAIDLGTETLPALALGIERPEPDVMQRPPRPRGERLLNRATLLRGYFYLGLLSSVGVMFGYFWQLTRCGWYWGVTGNDPLFAPGSLFQRQAATMVFLGIVIMQVANVFACRTERASVFSIGILSNPLIIVGIIFELAFAAIAIYVPFFQNLLGTAPVGWESWLVLFAFTPLVFGGEEARKAMMRTSGKHTRLTGPLDSKERGNERRHDI
ncbi:cation-translocating P-type ATPase [Desulfopila aestuarii]|nr:cation-transporting P-type ATPase [Desulfopila aestuarii]